LQVIVKRFCYDLSDHARWGLQPRAVPDPSPPSLRRRSHLPIPIPAVVELARPQA